jgi:hypothetical protein
MEDTLISKIRKSYDSAIKQGGRPTHVMLGKPAERLLFIDDSLPKSENVDMRIDIGDGITLNTIIVDEDSDWMLNRHYYTLFKAFID